MKKLTSLLLALAAALSLTACSADTVSEVFPELSQIVDEVLQTAEESSPSTMEFFSTAEQDRQEPSVEHSTQEEASAEEQEGFTDTSGETSAQPDAPPIAEDGSYTTKDDVALYIHTYGKLPQNFITKKQARELGWGGGSLEPYAPGMCIGGDRFGNYEGLLPEGRSYTECDVNTLGSSSRGAERIIFSADGLIYYTGDHYASFTLLYGEE